MNPFARLLALFVPSPPLEPLAYATGPDGISVIRLHNPLAAPVGRPWLSLRRVAVLGWVAGLILAFAALPQPGQRHGATASVPASISQPSPTRALAGLR